MPLSFAQQWLLALVSCALVAFGQPAWISWFGLAAAALGYALFWRVLLAHDSWKQRFFLSTLWFFGVQLVQLSWFISHPFLYIYPVYSLIALGVAFQFGILGLMITPKALKNVWVLGSIAGIWTIFEWLRLHPLSGLSWNPIGIHLTGNIYTLQAASIAGLYGLSFWIVVINLLALRAWVYKGKASLAAWACALLAPFLYGYVHLAYHENKMAEQSTYFDAMLVQTAFAPEEIAHSPAQNDMVKFVIDEWRQILAITKKYDQKPVQLIVLPEFVVPFGTYSFVYPAHVVYQVFSEVFGPESLQVLPHLEFPLSVIQNTKKGPQIMVNNAFWIQGLANYFQANVIAGLEDAEEISPGKCEYYSAAMFFTPMDSNGVILDPERYSKRVLVPLAEYIPFRFCEELASRYGVFSSFTHGKEAKVMTCGNVPISPSICYEETFGNIMREGRQKGAEVMVNLTSDVWYPNSKLPRQHLDHARVRTVENGIPLIRACNTGVTAAIDSLGKNVSVLGGDQPEKVEWVADGLVVHVPLYSYHTLYSKLGDSLIIGISMIFVLAGFLSSRKRP